jgi:hypothetical protein
MASRPVLPWVLREKLRLELRPKVQGAVDPDLFAELVADVVDDIAKRPGGAPLRAALKESLGRKKLSRIVQSWIAELPSTHRSDWLVERLADAIGITWGAAPTDAESTLPIPTAERDRIARRLEKMAEKMLTEHDADLEPEECADVLEEELERIAAKHEALAHRLATRRFPGTSHPNLSLTFRALLDARRITDTEELLQFAARELDLRWVEPDARGSKC